MTLVYACRSVGLCDCVTRTYERGYDVRFRAGHRNSNITVANPVIDYSIAANYTLQVLVVDGTCLVMLFGVRVLDVRCAVLTCCATPPTHPTPGCASHRRQPAVERHRYHFHFC